jgi:hypothetical protein
MRHGQDVADIDNARPRISRHVLVNFCRMVLLLGHPVSSASPRHAGGRRMGDDLAGIFESPRQVSEIGDVPMIPSLKQDRNSHCH